MEKTLVYCAFCGCAVDESETHDTVDGAVCGECKSDNYAPCDCCNLLMCKVDMHSTASGDYVCSDCLRDNYTKCHHCGELVRSEETTEYGYDSTVCNYCIDNYYDFCDSCNDLFHQDDVLFDDDGGCYCHSCAVELPIKPSYYVPDAFEFRGTGNLYLGVELEVECLNSVKDRYDLAYDLLARFNGVYLKRDFSLDYGFEIVSHPFTLEEHRRYVWKDLLEFVSDAGCVSALRSTCGLHIHASKAFLSEMERVKLGVFCARWHDEFERLARRKANSFCRKLWWDKVREKMFDATKKVEWCSESYSDAVNWNHYHTVEFRHFAGTLNYSTLLSTIELVHAVMFFVKQYGIGLCASERSWQNFREYCNSYKFLPKYFEERYA